MRFAILLESILFVSAPAEPPVAWSDDPPAAWTDTPGDPYGFAGYADFYQHVARVGSGTLVVGIPDKYVGTYTAHCRVPSGFSGLADGNYDCRKQADGTQTVTRRDGQKAAPFPTAITPDTIVRRAVGLSTSYPAFEPLTGRIGTSARWIMRGGGIENCGPVG